MTDENDFDVIRFDGLSLGDLIRQLQEGGPPVDEATLLAYAVDALDEPSRKAITARIVTWKAWYRAYWELRAELSQWKEESQELQTEPNDEVRSPRTDDAADQARVERAPATLAKDSGKRILSLALGEALQPEHLNASYRITADDCEWTPAKPKSMEETEAVIELRWESGRLEITVDGFLRVDRERSLDVTWFAQDGAERGRGTNQNPFVPTVEVLASGKDEPQIGDELLIVNRCQPARGASWTCAVRLRMC